VPRAVNGPQQCTIEIRNFWQRIARESIASHAMFREGIHLREGTRRAGRSRIVDLSVDE
jgi:hypothetical protein